MTTLPNCIGSYTKRSNCSKYLIKFPLGWNQSKGNYDYYHESVDSEPEAILVLKSKNQLNIQLFNLQLSNCPNAQLLNCQMAKPSNPIEQSNCTIEQLIQLFQLG